MQALINILHDGLDVFLDVMSTFRFFDLLDILIAAFLFYKLIGLIRETRAEQLLKGIVFLAVIYFAASWLKMSTLSWILDSVFQYGLIAIAVIFQPEIRRALERVGRSNITAFGRGLTVEQAEQQLENCLDNICRACQAMGKTKTGALIVIEQTTALGDIASSGTIVDAAPSEELICNIFFSKSPLHDGAIVIRNGRIYSARCILPLTQNSELSAELGTRHRAAIGMSENSDAVVVVVSEETGNISIAQNGVMQRDFNIVTLRTALNAAIFGDRADNKTNIIKKIFKIKNKKSDI